MIHPAAPGSSCAMRGSVHPPPPPSTDEVSPNRNPHLLGADSRSRSPTRTPTSPLRKPHSPRAPAEVVSQLYTLTLTPSQYPPQCAPTNPYASWNLNLNPNPNPSPIHTPPRAHRQMHTPS